MPETNSIDSSTSSLLYTPAEPEGALVCEAHENAAAAQSQPPLLVDPSLDPEPASEPLLPFNPVKTAVGLGNVGLGARSMYEGTEALASAVVAPEVAPIIVAAAAVELVHGVDQIIAGAQQMVESFRETSDDAAYKNLLGLVPFIGTEIDDRDEPGPGQYVHDHVEELSRKFGLNRP